MGKYSNLKVIALENESSLGWKMPLQSGPRYYYQKLCIPTAPAEVSVIHDCSIPPKFRHIMSFSPFQLCSITQKSSANLTERHGQAALGRTSLGTDVAAKMKYR